MAKMKYFFALYTLKNESTYILAYDKHHAKARALLFFGTDDNKAVVIKKSK